MTKIIRHDAITLHKEAKEADFERFMKDELIPFFGAQYKGPTRTSVADLKGQSLSRRPKSPGHYLWTTDWAGSPEAVGGSSFEHARMVKVDATETILKKLESFGKRDPEKIFVSLVEVEVGTNT